MPKLSTILELLWCEEYKKVEQSLLDKSLFINQKDENGRTLLHLLLMKMMTKRNIRLDAMRFLVTSGADVNIREESELQLTSLHLALKLCDPDLLQIVLDSSSFSINKYNTKHATVTSRLEPKVLSNLYLVGAPPIGDEDQLNKSLSSLQLQTLVITGLHLSKIPLSILDMRLTLRVLKLSVNRISQVPESIGCLTNLRILCLDHQTPKIKSIPKSFANLSELQVLSFSGNRLENVDWVIDLRNLQELRLDCNQISRLPSSICPLTCLISLNISYNRFQSIPSSYAQVIKKLRSFEYFSVTLRPLNVRNSISALITHLELQAFLSNVVQSPDPTARDIVVGVVGGSNSGKTSLVGALRDDRGICRFEGECRGAANVDPRNEFTSESFDLPDESGHFHHITMVTIDVDFIDFHIRDLWLDVILLTLDLTSFETQNGSQNFQAFRQIAGTQQWLECISEVFPNIPVILVGTKAELIKPSTFSVSLQMIEDLMDSGRIQHSQGHVNQLCPTCFLCSSRAIFSRCLNVKSSSKFSCIDFSLTSTYGMVTSPCLMAGSSDSTTSNGQFSPSAPRDSPDCEHSGVNFPHVIGYYEIDSRKCFPKENKRHNSSVELLRKAILRHFASDNCLYSLDSKMNIVPDAWMSFIKHFSSSSFSSSLPIVPYDQIVAICRGFNVAFWQIPLLLRYCHIRGRFLVVAENHKSSIKTVITSPNWLLQTGYKLLHRLENVITDVNSMTCAVGGILGPSFDSSVVKIILMGLCTINFFLEMPEDAFYVPRLSNRGDPGESVWSSAPDFEEKQITCELEIRRHAPFLFKDLIFHILSSRGKDFLGVQQRPTPLVLNDHVVFFVACDVEFCEDCAGSRRPKSLARASRANNFIGSKIPGNIFHKVRISSNAKQATFRVCVRGSAPCCVTKSVLRFIYLHLDDSEEGMYSKKFERNILHLGKSKVDISTLFNCCKVQACKGDCLFHVDDQEYRHHILCPKCVLSKRFDPQPILARGLLLKRKPLCDSWHHFGSWERAAIGNYQTNPAEHFICKNFMNTFIPDNETPRLAMLLLPTSGVCRRDWMSECKARFMEGFEIHFLCENLSHWHMVQHSGFRIIRARKVQRGSDGSILASVLGLALIFIQIIQGCSEFPCNSKLLLHVAKTFAETPEYQRFFESDDSATVNSHGRAYDHYCWLLRNKEKIISSLSKILAITGEGIPDLFFKNTASICADKLFQVPTTGSRTQLAKFLQVDLTSGSFGDLKPLYLGRELRWVCQEHYEQLLSL